jgi:hypothetical protein
MTSPFTEDYRNGEMVQCQRCAKNVRVKYFDKDTVVVVSTQEQQTLALRCQYCGYVMCDTCAHPADSLFPICPSCQREWGPYYFTHDVIMPSLSKAAPSADTPPVVQASPPEPLPLALEPPPEPTETIGAGETDLFGEYQHWERNKKIRKILAVVGGVILVGILIFLALGPGRPVLKKSLGALNKRPTKSPAAVAIVQQTATTTSTAPKTSLPTLAASLTPVKPSPTSAAATTKATATKKPTNTLVLTQTEAPTAMPTDTATPELSPTAPALGPGDCLPALSVTLDDVGKTLCVTGTVVFTMQSGNAFSIYFSNKDGYFRIVVYDRVPKDIKKDVCVRVTGEIKVLTGIPVMALGYFDVIEICSP